MSDHIAHLAVCDDTFRLALHHRRIEHAFKPRIGRPAPGHGDVKVCPEPDRNPRRRA